MKTSAASALQRFGLSTTARLGLALCLGLLLFNALVFFLYTVPRSLESRNVNERLAVLGDEARQLGSQLEARRAAVATRAANLRDEQRFLSEVAAERQPELLSTLAEIREIAVRSGVDVPSWSFDDKPMKDVPVDVFEITVPASGNYGQLVAFLDGLQRSRHFVAVDQLQLGGGENAEEPRLEMKLSAFFRGKR